MKIKFIFIILFVVFAFKLHAQHTKSELEKIFPNSLKVQLKNTLSANRVDVPIVLQVSDIVKKHKNFNSQALVVFSDNSEIASQANDLNSDGKDDEIVFVIDLKSGETKEIEILYKTTGIEKRVYKKRTQAELSHKFGGNFENRKYIGGEFRNVSYLKVPTEHTDHSFYIRYEGPGWESDKVGFRFYLDWRNATDVFGKKTNEMILQNVGLDGFDSYHEPAVWGQDVFKAGKSLGIGSFGILNGQNIVHVSVVDSVDCQIVVNGCVKSLIRTNYYGWTVGNQKYHVTSDISIFAGSRLTHVELTFNHTPDSLVTGFIRDISGMFFTDSSANFNAMALYQKCLANDNLGIAIIVPARNMVQTGATETDYFYQLGNFKNKVSYSFLAAWEQEPGGITNSDAFKSEIRRVLSELEAPIIIKIK